MSGWIKLHRKLQSNPIWLSEPFTRGQAWVDLILLANHSKGFLRARGVRVDVERGQVGMSHVKLSERWTWSRGKVKRFLNELETDQQIVQQNNNITCLISIVNYNEYQGNDTTDNTPSDTADGQQTVQQTGSKRYTNKKEKNTKEQKEIPKYIDSKLWADFLDMRMKKKAINSDRALKSLLKKLDDVESQSAGRANREIERSLINSWKDIYPDTRINGVISKPTVTVQKAEGFE